MNAPLTPLDGTFNIPLDLLGPSSSPVLPYKSEDPSNVAVDPMIPPTRLPWDPLDVPLVPWNPLAVPQDAPFGGGRRLSV